jgi:predicted nucleic acid-binding protein
VVNDALQTIYERFELYDSEALIDRAIDFAMRETTSVFDALYVLTALIADCTLVTADDRLVRATRSRYEDRVLALRDYGSA